MVRTMIRITALAFALSTLAAGAYAQTGLGVFSDWEAARTELEGAPVCYAASTPKSSLPAGARRGKIALVVSNRPSEKVAGEVMVMAGYPYRPDSEVTIDIGGKTFALFTNGENAWARDAAGDKALVDAMRAGNSMTVKGTSQRGTVTTDTYSLRGVSAALDKINAECPAR